jgi:hypothetical protein
MTTTEIVLGIAVWVVLAMVAYYVIRMGYESVNEYNRRGANLAYSVSVYMLGYAGLLVGVGAMVSWSVGPDVLSKALAWAVAAGVLGTFIFGALAVRQNGARRLAAVLALSASVQLGAGALAWRFVLG